MKKITLLFSTLLFLCFSINAQYAFKVLAAKGENQIFKDGTWNSLQAGTTLNSSEKIKVPESGYLGLIHSTGKTFEIETSGEFNISDLENQIKDGKAGFGEKYANFVSDGMFSNNENAANNFTNTGSVKRGDKSTIIIYSANSITALRSIPLELRWSSAGENHTYRISLQDFFGEIVWADSTSETSYNFDFSSEEFKSLGDIGLGNQYIIDITSLTDESYTTKPQNGEGESRGGYTIGIIEKSDNPDLFSSINTIEENMSESSAVDYLVLGSAYAELNKALEKEYSTLNFMAYAVDAFYKASELAPKVNAYQEQYEQYICCMTGWKNLNGAPVKK